MIIVVELKVPPKEGGEKMTKIIIGLAVAIIGGGCCTYLTIKAARADGPEKNFWTVATLVAMIMAASIVGCC